MPSDLRNVLIRACAGIVGVFVAIYAVSCVSLAPSPYSAIMPPGVHPLQSSLNIASNAVRTVLSATVKQSLTVPTITIYNDSYDWGGASNLLIHVGSRPGRYDAAYAFPATNTAFPLPLDTNRVSFLCETAIYMLPSPLTNEVTNLDGSVDLFVQDAVESLPSAELCFVPTNCPTICLADYPGDWRLIAWGNVGNLYRFESSPDLASWSEMATVVGTNGPIQVPVVAEGRSGYFRWQVSR